MLDDGTPKEERIKGDSKNDSSKEEAKPVDVSEMKVEPMGVSGFSTLFFKCKDPFWGYVVEVVECFDDVGS